MNRLLLFFVLLHTVFVIESCVIQQKKQEEPDIRVIQLGDSTEDSSEPEIVALHLSDRGRREVGSQARGTFCKRDEDCRPRAICFAHLICVEGIRRTPGSPGSHVAN